MSLISLNNLSLAFGVHALLDDVNLAIETGQRIALIGRNGEGKSSLLKIIAGQMQADSGQVRYQQGLKLAYVAQEPPFNDEESVFDAVAGALQGVKQALIDYHHTTQALEQAPPDQLDGLMKRLHEIQGALEANDGWQVQSRVESVLTRLALPADTPVGQLSGGWKKRVALAQAWVQEPQLMILDEPTNHLDLDGIRWLEEVLSDFPGSVLFITHDRRFLDRLAQRIWELDRGKITEFTGNFSAYQTEKARLLEVEAQHNQLFDKVLAQEEAWIRQGIKARRTRNEGRVRQLEALRVLRGQRRERQGQVNLQLDSGQRSGKEVAQLKHVSKSFGDRCLIKDFSCQIQRGDKIGLIGPNGAGKSTLIKLILGELQPDQGEIVRGTQLAPAYFDQFRSQLDDNATLLDVVGQGSDFIEINGKRKHIVGYLGDFLFSPARVRSPVRSLSGGERNRLLLARLFTQPANVLILDEPTNDLDIETLELLESLLSEYDGTVLLVSHDRYFLDNVVTQIIAFEGDGQLREYVGGYSDWEQYQRKHTQPNQVADKSAATQTAGAQTQTAARKPANKLSYKEQRELDMLPGRIEQLEQEQKLLTEQLNDQTLYKSDPDKVRQLQDRYQKVEQELEQSLDKWAELESRQG